jgi:hypothetical protein
MKRLTITTGICAVLLAAAIFVTGCTSSLNAPATDTGTIPQVTTSITPASAGTDVSLQLTPASVSAPVSDQGIQVDNAGNADEDAATVSADAAIDPYNSESQPTTMAPDSADLGNPIP